ncbi:MAG TPA: RNA polymerase sporulation sigma factor SigH [Clostridiales bacterium]|nr:RNA polymerase sporulation sigma factor SigH [Clostridiales bacterium]
MDKLTEDNLINLAKNGDEQAQETIFNSYKQLVSYVARHYFLIGGDQDDLIQEGMIGLYKAISSYDANKNANFSAYAKTLIERQVINAIKSDSALKHHVLNQSFALNNQGFIKYDEDEECAFLVSSNKETPENIVLSSEETKDIATKIVKVLSEYELKVLKLYLKGLSYNDIAVKIGATPKSVDNALNRIKTKLQFLKERN